MYLIHHHLHEIILGKTEGNQVLVSKIKEYI